MQKTVHHTHTCPASPSLPSDGLTGSRELPKAELCAGLGEPKAWGTPCPRCIPWAEEPSLTLHPPLLPPLPLPRFSSLTKESEPQV